MIKLRDTGATKAIGLITRENSDQNKCMKTYNNNYKTSPQDLGSGLGQFYAPNNSLVLTTEYSTNKFTGDSKFDFLIKTICELDQLESTGYSACV